MMFHLLPEGLATDAQVGGGADRVGALALREPGGVEGVGRGITLAIGVQFIVNGVTRIYPTLPAQLSGAPGPGA